VKRSAIKRKPRKSRHDSELAAAFVIAVLHKNKGRCIVTGERADEAHHVIPKGWLWARRWDFEDIQKVMWDPRNGVPVAHRAHEKHTGAARAESLIPRSALLPENFAFAKEHGLEWKIEDYPE
jgi:hypothetical protein